MEDFTDEELKILEDDHLTEGQLRNLRKVMNSASPKKLQKLEDEVLPGYITRHRNAKVKADKLMKKKGYHRG